MSSAGSSSEPATSAASVAQPQDTGAPPPPPAAAALPSTFQPGRAAQSRRRVWRRGLLAEQRGGLKHCAAITSSRSRSVGLRSKRKSASGLSGACGAWCAQVLLRRRAARPAGSAALADSVHDVRGSTHDARVPRGTRGTVRTSPRRLNEASPKLSMTVGEQLPPARTVAGSAGGQGFTFFSRPGGLTLRESDYRRGSVHG